MNERNGTILTRLMLSLVVPTICGELWLARNAWILDERVTVLSEQVKDLKSELTEMHNRLDQIQLGLIKQRKP